jgi:hypothetical protein
MCIEIGLESTRNPRVGEIFQEVDRFVEAGFEQLFARLEAEGRIAPELDIPTVAKLFLLIGDGLFWRRATDPRFDGQAMVPPTLKLLGKLLNPVPPAKAAEAPDARESRS